MSLLAEATALNTPQHERCTVAVLLDALDEGDRTDLLALLNDRSFAGSVIARALTNRGHDIKGQTIRRHRNRDCACL